MVHSKAFVLALATGFAAAKPVERREPEALPAYRRQINGFGNLNNVGVSNNVNSGNNIFNDFGNQFNRFNDQERVVQIQEQNIQIQDNGVQQAVVAQAREVLVVDQKNNNFNNLFRKANFRNNNRDQSVVMLVVQQVQVAVDQGNGNVFRQDIFAQSAVVANRGARSTRTVQIIDKRQLVATQVLNGFGSGVLNGVGGGIAAPTAAPAAAQQGNGTNNIALFGQMPQWNDKVDDPAAEGAQAWQQELADLNNLENLNNNNDENAKAAEQQKQNAGKANQDQAAKDQAAKDQAAKDQAAKDAAAKGGQQQAAAQDTAKQPDSAVAQGNNGEAVDVAKGGKQ